MTTLQPLLSPSATQDPSLRLGLRQRIARNLVHGQLAGLRTGRLTLRDAWSGASEVYGDGDGLDSSIRFNANSIENVTIGEETVSFSDLADLLDEEGETLNINVTDEGVFVADNSGTVNLNDLNDGTNNTA